ncbi:MAG: hypothetical protein ACR2KX_17485 [Chitinophagaceae bacterium]
MKVIFILAILFFATHSFSQITYTYVEPDPVIEKEKKDKETYFQNLIYDIRNKLRNCERQCGSYAADANNPKDPCIVPGVTPKCICDCRAFYNPSIASIEQQEKAWRSDIFKREEDYRKRKLKEQPSEANKVINEPSNATIQETKEENLDPIKQMQLKQQQTQQELNNAQNASTSAFETALNSGKKTSGAMVEATLAGAQYLSDPKSSLAFTGVGLGVAGLAALGERKEAKRLARADELKVIKESLQTSTSVFDFMSGVTNYHITSLKVEKKKNGRIKKIIRNDLYDISVTIHKITNSPNSITVFESVSFKSLNTSKDSCVVSKITIPINEITSVQAYNGNYTNSFNNSSNSYESYRYKELENSSIEYAFSMDGNYPIMPSGLSDVYIQTRGSNIKIQKKFVSTKPYYLYDNDFIEASSLSSSNYMLVFNDDNDKIKDFIDYLNL